MVGRVKFQVLGKNGWCTAYCKRELIGVNMERFTVFGIKCRIVFT